MTYITTRVWAGTLVLASLLINTAGAAEQPKGQTGKIPPTARPPSPVWGRGAVAPYQPFYFFESIYYQKTLARGKAPRAPA